MILHIDTATARGSVALSEGEKVLSFMENPEQRDHASMIPVYIKEMNIRPEELDAIAVSAGPGSYTGLRVGVATAKGLCYTWEKPLIAISTLQMMACGMQQQQPAYEQYIPMIDARRMEVFTAVYDEQLMPVMEPCAMVLEPHSFDPFISGKNTLFFGDGAEKWVKMKEVQTADYRISALHMIPLALKAFINKDFQDVAYFSPYYLKAFFHPGKQ